MVQAWDGNWAQMLSSGSSALPTGVFMNDFKDPAEGSVATIPQLRVACYISDRVNDTERTLRGPLRFSLD